MIDRRVVVASSKDGLAAAILVAATESGLLLRLKSDTRVALKPNFTYPCHKAGVTTSPAMIRETVRLLREVTSRIAIVESDGGYGSWSAHDAFHGHGLQTLR